VWRPGRRIAVGIVAIAIVGSGATWNDHHQHDFLALPARQEDAGPYWPPSPGWFTGQIAVSNYSGTISAITRIMAAQAQASIRRDET
jgi:hypothetical protein